ncbi:MAG: SDR family oxidoreductase [Candidatus Melainabacteria bacterium]|nr:SDR family oxidoreductase [Candidatus Melainabacteria bacterium]
MSASYPSEDNEADEPLPEPKKPAADRPILVTGATGYVGGRLVPRLLEAGYRVRAVGRSLDKLRARPWAAHANVQLQAVDVLDAESLARAMAGCGVCYYLVHSMNPRHRDFESADREAAIQVAQTAARSGITRIIYLSGLGEDASALSKHLRSRREVEALLAEGPVPVTVLRAAMIIGSGSASFEILRYLVERLPVMITPRWVYTPCQPIAIRNVLYYLQACLNVQETIGKTFDVGGANTLTYRELMEIYAQEACLPRRWILPVPVFTPRVSSYWIHLVTPVPASIAQPLAEGLRNPVVCQENRIQHLIPQPLLSAREAVRLALQRMQDHQVESHWTDAGALQVPEWLHPGDPNWAGGTVYEDRRRMILAGEPEEIWQPIVRIGGQTGWYYGNWMWGLRGILDLFFGGIGLRKGRRHPVHLFPGDALDFWRVLAVDAPWKLLLAAEMRVPGEAVLEFQLNSRRPGETELVQTARFRPYGLLGMLYWWLVTPLHHWVFNGMLKGIAKASGRKLCKGPNPVKVLSAGGKASP